jgi:hypothetical protein
MSFDFNGQTVFKGTEVGVIYTVVKRNLVGNLPAAIVPGKRIVCPVRVFIDYHKCDIAAVKGLCEYGEIVPCCGYFISGNGCIVLIKVDKLFV